MSGPGSGAGERADLARRRHPAVERMAGVDASFLYLETPTVHMHTLKIAVIDGSPHLTWETLQAGLLARIKRLPPLRRRVVPVPLGLNHPVWVTLSRIDPKRHLVRHRVPGDGTMRDLEELIGRIASTPLDRRHPLWELHYCEGLEGGRVAVVGKMHHALADGSAASALLANVTDVRSAVVPPTPDEEYETTDRPPGRWRLLRDGAREGVAQAFSLPALLRRTVRGVAAVVRYRRTVRAQVPLPVLDAPRVSFNGRLTRHRTFATVGLDLADLKRVRAQHADVTLNDLVLAVVSGALRRWMDHHGERPTASLTAGVPVATDEPGAEPRLGGNQLSNLFTTLATDVDDAVTRLQVIARTTDHAKQVQARLGRQMMNEWTQFAPPAFFPALVRGYSGIGAARWHPSAFNVIVSNVPGPREQVTIGGARLDGLFSVGPLVEGIGLNVTVWSYVGRMNFSLLACPDLLPDVERLAAFFPEALAELDLERAGSEHGADQQGADEGASA